MGKLVYLNSADVARIVDRQVILSGNLQRKYFCVLPIVFRLPICGAGIIDVLSNLMDKGYVTDIKMR